MKPLLARIKNWIKTLSFRTGCIVAAICAGCYVVSFLQMLLPLPVEVKGGLWVLFFGLAKASQYAALLILGKAGAGKLKRLLALRRR